MNVRIQSETIHGKIKEAAAVSGRTSEEITIVAVTKAFPVDIMNSAVENGFTVLGESRVQEIEKKLPDFKYRDQAELHLIGHLQSNKAKKAVEIFDIIQSVDSVKLATRINRHAAHNGKKQSIFIQVNSGNDPAKFGLSTDEALRSAEDFCNHANLSVIGIMVIAPYTKDHNSLRSVFSSTRKLRDSIRDKICSGCTQLSMGMSGDFPIAIEEGATHVRIGSALFGERPKW